MPNPGRDQHSAYTTNNHTNHQIGIAVPTTENAQLKSTDNGPMISGLWQIHLLSRAARRRRICIGS